MQSHYRETITHTLLLVCAFSPRVHSIPRGPLSLKSQNFDGFLTFLGKFLRGRVLVVRNRVRFCQKLKKAQNYDFLQSEFFERTHINFRAIVRRRYVKVRVVQVRACGRDEIVLCGKAQKPFRVRFVEGGVITFKPVKSVRHQPRDKKFQLVFRDIHGVRDNRNAAVFLMSFTPSIGRSR